MDPTLDQLRVLAAVADEGSFSAAARRLHRVQSAVSHAVATLESTLDTRLFDRATRVPTLTGEGRAVLAQARRVLDEADGVARLAQELKGGVEQRLAIVVDAVFPVPALVSLCREIERSYPRLELVLHTEVLSAVSARVRDGSCDIGVTGPAADVRGLETRFLASVRMVPVVARAHPLARVKGRVPNAKLREHVQIVLSERDAARATDDQGVVSPKTWRVVDLATKHALLLGGRGWGNLPEHMIDRDLKARRLVRIRPAAWGDDEHLLSLSAVWSPSTRLGPAARWAIERMAALCAAR